MKNVDWTMKENMKEEIYREPRLSSNSKERIIGALITMAIFGLFLLGYLFALKYEVKPLKAQIEAKDKQILEIQKLSPQ